MGNILTEVMSIVYENRHKGIFTVDIQTNISYIGFIHFDDNYNHKKCIRSYYEGNLKESNDGFITPLKSFIPELTKYVESL